ncbi:MAG: 4-hydroxy-3-methylbut-2-enyl diphosphate reductase [Planctomycetota bacterium]|jgi:4-hydroxy-3-methylbut-2-enyl diphosphate reductase|nr:4-hydroxy-3-methylbut-2-enyl diphosphate reductase [Planctomycetota bacterium]
MTSPSQDPSKASWRTFDTPLIEHTTATSKLRPVSGLPDPESDGQSIHIGPWTLRLARKFGFCYGVKFAVKEALDTLAQHADRRILVLHEIIHNPYVNEEMGRRGAHFMDRENLTLEDITSKDVVIVPAFGTTIANFETLNALRISGCLIVDTTCRSVVDVWNRIEEYNAQEFTSIIHGKHEHEETIATASVARKHLIVRDRDEAGLVCDFIRGAPHALSPPALRERFARATSDGFDPEKDLLKIGLANQTTMRAGESVAIFEMFREAVEARFKPETIPERFLTLDTICQATQVRQDAILELSDQEPIDVTLVLGGYNSSNTANLARIANEFSPAYHIRDANCFDLHQIEHQPYGSLQTVVKKNWLPPSGGTIALTAGASTPDDLVGSVIEKLTVIANSEPISGSE